MATREAACHCGQLRLEAEVRGHLRRSATTRASRTRPERSTSSISVLTAARRCSARNRRSLTASSSCRRVRRPVVPAADGVGLRLSPSSLGGAAGLDPASRQRTGCSRLLRARYDEADRQGSRAHRGLARPGVPVLQRRLLREPCRPQSRRHRAPRPGDRQVGWLPSTWRSRTPTSIPLRTSQPSRS